MAEFQTKPYPSFAQQPSVAGDNKLVATGYDENGFERFNDEHLNLSGVNALLGGDQNV